ncbi:Ribonuclease H1 [Toxocara canis]|uniref:ribonuclease H n=1 Tax=Toxocara canis TaxID=6265 RepID=A0A0B2UZZ9_TOXCA|nr:Ribonuclease H1 [Toxocara canis]
MKRWCFLIRLRNIWYHDPCCSLHEGTSSLPRFDSLINRYKAAVERTAQQELEKSSVDWLEQKAWLSAPIVYCDGAYDWNTGKAGVGIFWGPSDSRNLHLEVTGAKITNIRAEIQAVSLAILQASSLKLQRISIKTDCNFAVKVINLWLEKWRRNGWRKAAGGLIENVEDIKKLNERLQLLKVRIEHVYGHQKFDMRSILDEHWQELPNEERDAYGNFHSDRLAQLGIDQPMMTDVEFELSIPAIK